MQWSKLLNLRWKFISLILLIVSVAAYFLYYPPIPTTCSLPEREKIVIYSGRRYQNPIKPIDTLFLLDPEKGTIWRWVCTEVTGWDIAWIPAQQILSLYTDEGMLTTYQLSPSGDFSKSQLISDVYGEHTWAPEGEKIVYASPESPGGNIELYLHDVDNSESQRLTFQPTNDNSPSWAPNGKEIVFESYERDTQSFSLHKINADGSELTPLADQIGGDNWEPKWSPDGTKIAFLHSNLRDKAPSLWVMNTDGGEMRVAFKPRATESNTFAGGVSSFSWSPDSKQLVFASGHEGPCSSFSLDAETTSCGKRIYIVNVDGSGLKKITNRPQPHYCDFIWIR